MGRKRVITPELGAEILSDAIAKGIWKVTKDGRLKKYALAHGSIESFYKNWAKKLKVSDRTVRNFFEKYLASNPQLVLKLLEYMKEVHKPFEELESVKEAVSLWKRKGVSADTRRNYLRWGKWIYNKSWALFRKKPEKLSDEEINKLAEYMQEEGLYKFSNVVAVRNAFKYIFKRDVDRYFPTPEKSLFEKFFVPVKYWHEMLRIVNERPEELDKILKDDLHYDTLKLILLMKPTTGIRTGERKKNKGLWGLTINTNKPSTIIIDLANGEIKEWRVWEKKSIYWRITVYPKELKDFLVYYIKKYKRNGKYLIPGKVNRKRINTAVRWLFKTVGLEYYANAPMPLHVFRSFFISWLIDAGIPLEIAQNINVSWLDLNTLKKYYLRFSAQRMEKYAEQFASYLGSGEVLTRELEEIKTQLLQEASKAPQSE